MIDEREGLLRAFVADKVQELIAGIVGQSILDGIGLPKQFHQIVDIL